jgi:colanic acid/amylovoran biosynthesis glycosyltransferase
MSDGTQVDPARTKLLLDVGVPFRVESSVIYLESQAHHGVRQWLDNFDEVTLCAPAVPQQQLDGTMHWTSAADLIAGKRFSAVLLPWAYAAGDHLTNVFAVRNKLRQLIPRHTHLCFSNLGWLGAWGRIGCEEAYRLGRPYAIWLDWVLHEMPAPKESNPVKWIWRQIQRGMLKRKTFRDIQRASLGLFNGKTVHDAYAHLCKVSRIAHDIHLGEADVIPASRLQSRLTRSSGPLKIIYVGRVHQMKGPWHWLDAIQAVIDKWHGTREIHAAWLGDGPLLPDLRRAVEERQLQKAVRFPGAELDRLKLLEQLRDADVFVFCHLTPESPRCLIEALMSALPIVGFESAYASDLLDAHAAGGALVAQGDVAGLADAVLACLREPDRLRTMSEEALSAGLSFSDVAVFKHRSDLIKEFL